MSDRLSDSLFNVLSSSTQTKRRCVRLAFFFGLLCLGLALAEVHTEWGNVQRQKQPDYWVDPYTPTRLLFIMVTIFFGLTHIIAALLRDHFYPVICPARGTLSKSPTVSKVVGV